ALVSLAGCASMRAPVSPPPSPPASPGGCSPGWTLDSDGRCQRDPSNFGGPPIYLGPQVGATPAQILRSFAAVSPSIAARSASVRPGVPRIWSTDVFVHGYG